MPTVAPAIGLPSWSFTLPVICRTVGGSLRTVHGDRPGGGAGLSVDRGGHLDLDRLVDARRDGRRDQLGRELFAAARRDPAAANAVPAGQARDLRWRCRRLRPDHRRCWLAIVNCMVTGPPDEHIGGERVVDRHARLRRRARPWVRRVTPPTTSAKNAPAWAARARRCVVTSTAFRSHGSGLFGVTGRFPRLDTPSATMPCHTSIARPRAAYQSRRTESYRPDVSPAHNKSESLKRRVGRAGSGCRTRSSGPA